MAFRRVRSTATVVGKGQPLAQFEIRESRTGGRLVLPVGTIRFEGVTMTGVDLSDQEIANFVALGSTFQGCNFRNVVIRAGVLGHLPRVVYSGCDFSNSDLRDVSPMMARFERCVFGGAVLDGWRAQCAEFVHCRFAGRVVRAKFSAEPIGPCSKLLSGIRSVNEFVDNDFTNAELVDCRIAGGIDIDRQRWPTNDQYIRLDRLQERIRCARRLVESQWPVGLERDRALNLMELYSSRDYSKQEGIVLRRDDVYDYGRWTDRLWTLLEEC